MNLKEYIQGRQKDIDLANQVNEMGLIDCVSNVSDKLVFFKDSTNIEEARRLLRSHLGNEKLVWYYMHSENTLALMYKTPDGTKWIFFKVGAPTELQIMLDQVSKGRCAITKETSVTEQYSISCNSG